MYAIFKEPSNLVNKINFEQKQDVPAGLQFVVGSVLNGYWTHIIHV